VLPDSDEEQAARPSSKKKTQVASPRRLGNSKVEPDEWRQHVCNVLEIANAKCHGLQTQLKGIRQGLEAVNVEHRVVRMQLEGICQALEYIAGISYKAYIRSHGGLAGGKGKGSSQGIVRLETREAGVWNSKLPTSRVLMTRGKGKRQQRRRCYRRSQSNRMYSS